MFLFAMCRKEKSAGVKVSPQAINSLEIVLLPSDWIQDSTEKFVSAVYTVCPLDENISELKSYLNEKEIENILPVESEVEGGMFYSVYATDSLQRYTIQFFFFPDEEGTVPHMANKFIVEIKR